MTLPAPNLDDRRFQDLVDDAKRYVQQRCPEWSDHNVSDPGVTLIETFAMMVDQLLYRLNRVPDRLYVRFLELLGISLFPPSAAQVDVTFWLSAPRAEPVVVPAGTEVATPRTESEDAVVFTTFRDLHIVPCALTGIATWRADARAEAVDRNEQLAAGEPFPAFAPQPGYGDSLLIGLSAAAPSCAVALRFGCDVEGVGVDPRQPPLVWEAWTGSAWEACELERDETGGLNRPGDVVIHVPAGHTASVVAGQHAGWLRCRVVPAVPGQPFYTASPRVHAATAFTIGGTATAEYAETVRDETVGVSEGVPGQRFPLARGPVLAGDTPLVVEVATGNGWEVWTQVEHFAASTPVDRHFVLDAVTGEIGFGPAVRQADGTVVLHGAIPPKAAPIRVRSYRVGGGRRGNVTRGAVRALRSSLPYVARVENRKPAFGGVDGEDVASAKVRAPLLLRSQHRAVTAADYEYLAAAAAPQVARVRCVPAPAGEDPAIVRVLLVPNAETDAEGRVPFDRLRPDRDLLERVTRYLDERRVLGTRLVVEPPRYHPVTVAARIDARPTADPERLRKEALAALYRYLHPLEGGGPDGAGWPFGRPVNAGELFAALQRLPGVDMVQEVRLFTADLATGQRGEATSRIELGPHTLPYSYEHYVKVSTP